MKFISQRNIVFFSCYSFNMAVVNILDKIILDAANSGI